MPNNNMMQAWGNVGEGIGQIAGGQSNSLARALLLKQFSSDESYKSKVKIEALKTGYGVQENNLGEPEPTDPNMSQQEFSIALEGYQKSKKQRMDMMVVAGNTILKINEHWEKLAKDASPEQKRRIAKMQAANLNQEKLQGIVNPFYQAGYNFEEDLQNNLTFKDNLVEGLGQLLIQARDGSENAVIQIKSISALYPDIVKDFGLDPKWSREEMADQLMSPEAKFKMKAKNEAYLKQQAVNIEKQGQKDVIDYRIAKERPKTEVELTRDALDSSSPTSQQSLDILNEITSRKSRIARASGEGVTEARLSLVDVEGTARAIVTGRETIENVKNTFGLPVQEAVRKKVLALDPNFNFLQPRVTLVGVRSSIQQQQKNRGMMGSFVGNIGKQVQRISEIYSDIVSRVGIRALDLPKREMMRSIVGSGNENVIQAYMKEISAEIAKLSQGSAASIAQLPESNRQEWERIHDPNLSLRELLKILNETNEMANMRLQSVDEEIEETLKVLDNVRETKRPDTKNQQIEQKGSLLPETKGNPENDPLGLRRR